MTAAGNPASRLWYGAVAAGTRLPPLMSQLYNRLNDLSASNEPLGLGPAQLGRRWIEPFHACSPSPAPSQAGPIGRVLTTGVRTRGAAHAPLAKRCPFGGTPPAYHRRSPASDAAGAALAATPRSRTE
eukprot:scaffold2824_cov372-Prasinococcus_capsulatus_cf.AAC.11